MNQTKLFIRNWRPEGPAIGRVVVAHGLAEHSGRYEWVAGRLTEAGYTVTSYDARGHGRSPGRRGHADSYGQLLDDLAWAIGDERGTDGPLFLYGHSLGGGLVLNYALAGGRRAVDGVVASSPLILPTTRPPAWKVHSAKLLTRWWPTARFNPSLGPGLRSHDPQVDKDYEADPLTHECLTARLGVEALRAGRRLLERAGELRTPTLLMHGEADTITSAAASEEFARRAGSFAEYAGWAGKLHELHWEDNREEVLASMLAWLAARRNALLA